MKSDFKFLVSVPCIFFAGSVVNHFDEMSVEVLNSDIDILYTFDMLYKEVSRHNVGGIFDNWSNLSFISSFKNGGVQVNKDQFKVSI